jgi:SNF2-related domain
MASPGPAEQTGNQDSADSKHAFNSQGNHSEPAETSEVPMTVPVATDAQTTHESRSLSRPKSEEPPLHFSDIPEEVVSTDSVSHVGESSVLDSATNRKPPMAPATDENTMLEVSKINNHPMASVNPAPPRTVVFKKKLFKTPKERDLEAAENERRIREAGDLFRLSLQGNPLVHPTPQSVTSPQPAQSHDNNDVQIFETGHHQSAPIDLGTDAEDDASAARFKFDKRNYERKKKRSLNTLEDDIVFSKARNAEEHRLKLKSSKRAYKDAEDDESLFIAETSIPADLPEGEDSETPIAPKRRKLGRTNRIPESVLQDASQLGFAALEAEDRKRASKKRGLKGPAAKKESKGSKARISKSKDRSTDGVPKAKRGRPCKGPEMTNIETLFNNDIVSAAQANIGKAAQPGFTSTNKKNALAELIASIPEDERTTHNADKNALDKATKSFSGFASMKADGNDGWRLRGMLTSLYHYQLLGAAFMRDRENSSGRPYGGLQTDEMGLGKTVTCLANIVDGQAPQNSPNRTTLIVCPSGLCSQWLSEIKKHVHPKTFQEVITYRPGTRLESTDPVKTLSNVDIIITSYSEVMRSYPHCDTPRHLVTPEGRKEWWKDHFNANRGVLHKIYFRRIVLDEGMFSV